MSHGVPGDASPTARPESIFRKRLRKFRRLKRGYYSFLVLAGAFVLSLLLPLLVNDKAIVVHYDGEYFFPIRQFYDASTFGAEGFGEPNYRALREHFREEGGDDWVLLPPYPYSPTESLFELDGFPPHTPQWPHIFGTDDRGRDVFARLAYGFNVSLSFALLVMTIGVGFGMIVGSMLGYFGGRTDILGQRLIEIWSALPFLYTIIIVSSVVVPIYLPGRNLLLQPSFWLLIGILAMFEWIGITYYMRGEFYREKAKDYVGAAIVTGVSRAGIMFHHILPNSLTPVVSFAPFILVANITTLVALDFLGFGLPAPTPSWGELINQGMENLRRWWLVFFPLGVMFATLLLVVFIGEAVREAFDPREYSRLR